MKGERCTSTKVELRSEKWGRSELSILTNQISLSRLISKEFTSISGLQDNNNTHNVLKLQYLISIAAQTIVLKFWLINSMSIPNNSNV
jgi:hypothetical protein